MAEKIVAFPSQPGKPPTFDGGGGGGYDGGMEKRVEKLEEIAEKSAGRLASIEQDIAVIKSNYATKSDISAMVVAMHSDINSQTWKLVTFVCSFGTALVAAVYFIASHTK